MMIEQIKYRAEEWCEILGDESHLSKYRKHLEPLGIKAKGDVLIIGAGPLMEEIGVIEQDMANGDVRGIHLVGGDCFATLEMLQCLWPSNYPKISRFEPSSYQQFFQSKPDLSFDTIMFIGILLFQPAKTLSDLATRLNRGGRLYATVNYRNSLPASLEIPNCDVRIIPKIPTHPNYDIIPNYYGVVVNKHLENTL